MIRVRINYSKTGALRYTGHLDFHKVWERAIRRANLPIAYSQGFHPQPKINQACPLPLGVTSQAEILDMWLEQDLKPAEIKSALKKSVPAGIRIHSIEIIDLNLPKLQTQVCASEYEADFVENENIPALRTRISDFLAEEKVIRCRRNKEYDLRPLVQELDLIEEDNEYNPRIRMLLTVGQNATGRADEVIEALEIPLENVLINRTRLFLEEKAA